MPTGSEIHQAMEQPAVPTRDSVVLSGNLIPYVLSTADALIILFSCVGAGLGYEYLAGYRASDLLPYCALGLLAAFIHISRMSGSGYYELFDSAKPTVEITEVVVVWSMTGLLLAFFAFLFKVSVFFSRGAFIGFYVVTPVGLLGVRKLTKYWLSNALVHDVIGRRDVVILGDRTELDALDQRDMLGFVGAPSAVQFALSDECDPNAREAADRRTLASLSNFVRQNDCRELLVILPWHDSARFDLVRDYLKTVPIAARLLPDMRVRTLTSYVWSARQRVLTVDIQRAPLTAMERLVKRGMDIVLSSLALLFLSPVLLLTAVAIKIDSPGPVIFKQSRKGFNGKEFVMFKFRTMTVQENGPDIVQAVRNDPRVTRVGKPLRAASIDELPQFLNVLRGEMSLIGPRPHALAHDSYFEKALREYAFRHHVKPGMTGWAQCNGARGATPSLEYVKERVKLDLWYINNWSLWLDVQILIKTFFEVLRKRNAY
ncbi:MULTISPECIES: undecaprenyl-phosphate glucose phosphotransferase [unclassified Bradyrhizobium]|uniref:undecaprenyl-phosphate glucose phosphotransferase n=2 Tax=unclassified Bradyrhizobium TaxID=2631580 RepID=UPI0028F038AF|nr:MULTISPECIES: undecaprenyl-phosphate glucose phosphotransferase [unclassified Bradyrhizobium]